MTEIHPSDLVWDEAVVHEGRKINCIATFDLQVISSRPASDAPSLNESEKRVLADLPAIMEQAEEELSRRLPASFRVQITEWNEEPTERGDGDE